MFDRGTGARAYLEKLSSTKARTGFELVEFQGLENTFLKRFELLDVQAGVQVWTIKLGTVV